MLVPVGEIIDIQFHTYMYSPTNFTHQHHGLEVQKNFTNIQVYRQHTFFTNIRTADEEGLERIREEAAF